ncbi:alpha/beta fold hydrolase [Stenotrophomonas sp. ATCM1_4]|uniref:alpha/beta hydrolase family protein n=1 Tax=Stenotrophomonas sp. ATCM1_4 TaxID=2259330 RepID=UPI0010492E3B|nr:alpha/beta fold hydrolase [Stenotrophomonas sp. ATCM1_4]TDB29524.1 alpha/beta fold hydrolase [Stenotrophomonas sp. ATCM1_4]
MDIELDHCRIGVTASETVEATVLSPQRELPGVLFVHGWGGSQEHDLGRAREAAALGCVCLTFDLRGHRAMAASRDTVTRPQNLQDLCAAYDWLVRQPHVDQEAIAVIGISYGGYLAALLSRIRSIRWLALRTPAIYLDRDWEAPKRQLNADPELPSYRRRPLAVQHNRALQACARFTGDVLLVEAEHDEIIPRQVIENYASAFTKARSMTRRLIRGAGHAFDDKSAQKDYTDVLVDWMTEMIVGSRGAIAERKVREYKDEGRIDALR